MAATQKKYDEQSISALRGAERVRKRPEVIFGAADITGCQHSVFEIVSNSVDEAREGHGDRVIISVFRDHSVQVEDFGRGVPMDYNEKEKQYNWFLVFCEMYAGGKYENDASGTANYKYSLGLNGLGACATQYASDYMHVESYKSGVCYIMNFKDGEPATKLAKRKLRANEKQTGTIIRWRPSLQVFNEINIPLEYYQTTLHHQSVVNAGVHFTLRYEKEDGTLHEQEFFYENGITDYLAERVGDQGISTPKHWMKETVGRDREDKPDYSLRIEIAFTFSNEVTFIEYFHNSSPLEQGGSPDKAVRTAFLAVIDKYLSTKNKYTKNEKITFADIESSLALITNCFSTQTSYANQTKKAINNQFVTVAMTDFIKQELEAYFAENPEEAETICRQVLQNMRAREAAEVERLHIRKQLSGTMDVAARVEKFVNCRSKDPERRELYIVEGDSALTSCKLGRAAEYQAIIPVRGKTLNCRKSTLDKIFKSEIIVNLLRVIGCGVEIETQSKKKREKENVEFNLDALKWSKIIICTDADEDGFQIRTLLLTFFNRLLPTLIREKRVYIAESPLFEIKCKNDTYFAYSDREKADILAKLGDAKYEVHRSKGLGENEADMMWQTTMNPATRRLICVSEEDAAATDMMFEILLGDDLEGRKKFIAEHSSEYMKLADI